MKADGTPETEFEEAMPLMAQLVGQNVRNLQWTNDQLLANKEQELLRLQKDYMKLYHSMEKVYQKTDSGTARDALDRFSYQYGQAAEAVAVTKDSY